ncbi:MAG TPA: vitamin K epoxide reductase family protein [Gemmatimonadales bacterium]|nr:vitamin K epoxide reductase family protein [Gemmatimonadales bacterium]
MASAVLSLAGIFIALYLYLHKLGLIGTLACGTGGCETVQSSSYSTVLGVNVPLIGVVGYAAVLVLSVLALARPRDPRWPRLLLWGAVLGTAFTAYLTCIELFVIRAICRWCVGSAVVMVSILIAAWLGRPEADPGAK